MKAPARLKSTARENSRATPAGPEPGGASRKAKPRPDSESKNARDFMKIAAASAALGLGCTAAVAASLRGSATGFSFRVSVGTFVTFAVATWIAARNWKLVITKSAAARRAVAFLLVSGAGLFLYPLRYVPSDRLTDIAQRLFFAGCAIGFVGCLLWRLKRFFDFDAKQVKREDGDRSNDPALFSTKPSPVAIDTHKTSPPQQASATPRSSSTTK